METTVVQQVQALQNLIIYVGLAATIIGTAYTIYRWKSDQQRDKNIIAEHAVAVLKEAQASADSIATEKVKALDLDVKLLALGREFGTQVSLAIANHKMEERPHNSKYVTFPELRTALSDCKEQHHREEEAGQRNRAQIRESHEKAGG